MTHSRLWAAVAFLSGSSLFAGATAAITKVTLSNLAQPSSGQALVGYVSVAGEGFPTGTIPPHNVTVTLQPATVGGGPAGTTLATSVPALSGSKKRVVFQVPASIAVSTPVAYKVAIAGSTSAGAQFRSRNSSALTVNPPSQITGLSPNSANAGMSISVAITGLYTNFVQGATVANFGPGVSVGGAAQGQPGPVTVTSATTATAQIAVSPTAAAGPVTVIVTTGAQTASLAGGFTIIPPAQILSLSPNSGNAGMSISVAITGLYTNFVQGATVASFGPGVSVGGATQGQPGPVTVTGATTATAQIAISSTAAAGAVTVTVATGAQVASLAGGFTIIPPAQITGLSPNSANAALSLPVVITGQYTNFVQGTTVASFGPSISVGGAAQGQAGPVTVASATTATAQITIDPAAATGPVTVTVTTGTQQASLGGGFTVNPAVAVVNVTTTATTPLPPGFSGFSDPYLFTGVEYTDPKYIAMIQPLKPGFIRFPGGLQSMAFDWQTGHLNQSWINKLAPNITPLALSGLNLALQMTQAKGGACFTSTTGGTCYSNYADLVNALGVATIVDFNGWTDTNPGSAANMVAAAQAAGLKISEWELTNEPYIYTKIFPTASSYAASQYPYAQGIFSANPNATLGLFYQGQFNDVVGNYQAWDRGMAAYTPHYWNAVSMHVYPISSVTLTASQEEQTLNGVLAHGTNEYIASYVQPLIGADTPLFITEFNSDTNGDLPFESYIYNGIFLAEYIARMSTASNIKAISVQPLFLGNSFNYGIIRAVDDFQSYLLYQYVHNHNYSTNTATDPNTQFSFYPSANALALQVLNQAVNSSTFTWATTVSGGPTVPILGYDGNPIPAVFAQGYQGAKGTHYLVITNKSGASVPLGVEVNGTLGPGSVTVSYISNPSDTAQNTATAQTAVQVVNATWSNPMTIGPYSVTTLQW
jgi:hypothetical protein